MKYSWGIFVFIAVIQVFSSCSQKIAGGKTVSPLADSAEKHTIGVNGYFDGYYAFDFNEPESGARLYSVNNSRHNSFSVNQAFISIDYTSPNVRAKVTPAFGTYMNANYASEPAGFRNLMEASAGVKLHPKRNIWMDAGIMPSPIAYESAIAAHNIIYTRTIGAEFSPYYLMGVKLSAPVINKQITASLYVVNGWQQISDVNNGKSVLLQFEYKKNQNWLANLNLWAGSERNLGSVQFRNRYFADIYMKYAPEGKKLSVWTDGYYGIQERQINSSMLYWRWWQVNIAMQYQFAKKFSLAVRAEYFQDKDGAVVIAATPAPEFKCSSFSLCSNYTINRVAAFRLEARSFSSVRPVFIGKDGEATPSSYLAIAGFTVRF